MDSYKQNSILILHILCIFVIYSEAFESLVIVPGIEIVKLNQYKDGLLDTPNENDLFQSSFNFLKTHEIKLELSRFLNGSVIDNALNSVSETLKTNASSSQGMKKKINVEHLIILV